MSNKSSSTRVEKYPLPPDVEGIISLIREVLSVDGVLSFELDVSKPVRVVRSVEVENPDLIEPDVDYDSALKNINMVEYVSEGSSSYQVVVDMMQILHSEKLHCVCWVTGTGDLDLLNNWLEFEERGMPPGVDRLLGLPVRRLSSLPEDTLILCGSQYLGADPSELSFAVKTALEIRRSNEPQQLPSCKTDDPVGPNPREHAAAASQLAFAVGGLRPIKWNPGV